MTAGDSMIPGAFEKRAALPGATPSIVVPIERAPPASVADAAKDRNQLEHEREGGGAPSQRQVKE